MEKIYLIRKILKKKLLIKIIKLWINYLSFIYNQIYKKDLNSHHNNNKFHI